MLEAIIEVGQEPGTHNADSHAFTHKGVVKEVPMTVNTDDFTGKIVAARPERK